MGLTNCVHSFLDSYVKIVPPSSLHLKGFSRVNLMKIMLKLSLSLISFLQISLTHGDIKTISLVWRKKVKNTKKINNAQSVKMMRLCRRKTCCVMSDKDD